MTSKPARAWWGALIGFHLAAPLGPARSYRRLPFYEPVPTRMQPNPAFDWWLAASAFRLWGDRGTLTEMRRRALPDRRGALAFAMVAADRGFVPPSCGRFGNPLAEDGSAFDRALYWGLTMGNPRDAELAREDVAFSQSGEGLGCALALAILVAGIRSGQGFGEALATALPLLSGETQRAVEQVVAMGWSDEQMVFDRLRQLGAGARFEFLGLVASLRRGESFSGPVLAAAGLGLRPATVMAVGAVAAMQSTDDLGEWTRPLGTDFVSTGLLSGVEAPARIQDFVETLLAQVPAPAPFPVAPDVEPEGADPLDLPTIAQLWVALAHQSPSQEVAPGVRALYLSDWSPEKNSLEMGLEFVGPQRVLSQVSGDGPVHTRNLDTLVAEGQTLRQALLLGAGSTSLTLNLEGHEPISVPVPPATELYTCGPLAEEHGATFPLRHSCEEKLNTSETFSGRSGLGVKWTRRAFPANVFKIDPLFLNGPGRMFFAAQCALQAGQTYTLVFSASPGGVAVVNGQELIRYLDSHSPTHRAEAPYSASFVSQGLDTFVFRVPRPDQPNRDMAIYLLDARGHAVPLISQEFPA
ncbi:MAG: hypothetical protein JNJ45_04130 [Chthonomonas sp.]|nr:hypothetical protein [Chthonomonas sp.]